MFPGWLNLPNKNPLPFIRAVGWRVVLGFLLFNLLYVWVQPLDRPGWSLYNHVFPGRLRMAWADPDTGSALVPETRLPRLINDHVIARPKQSDEYRVVVLGSSEMWGAQNKPQEPMPLVLDVMALKAPDGRRMSFYNLSYVVADQFKDLMILDYLLEEVSTRPDLILLTVNPHAYQPVVDTHWLVKGNPQYALAVRKKYQLDLALPAAEEWERTTPLWYRRTFFADRDDIAYALMNQVYGLVWGAAGVDYNLPLDAGRRAGYAGNQRWKNERPGTLEALVGLARKHNLPVLLVANPINFHAPGYPAYLARRAQQLDLPVLDCSKLLKFDQFTNTNIHITALGHRQLAGQVQPWLEQQIASPLPSGQVTFCPAAR